MFAVLADRLLTGSTQHQRLARTVDIGIQNADTSTVGAQGQRLFMGTSRFVVIPQRVLDDAEIKRDYEYLYSSGSEHVLMDLETYDQITLDDLRDAHRLLEERAVFGKIVVEP